MISVTKERIASLFEPRPLTAHKGSCGRLLSICGSYRMPGAAVLAAEGALRTGIGLLVAAMPDPAYPLVAAHLTTPVFLPVPATPAGTLSLSALPALKKELARADAVLIGCGVGRDDETDEVVAELLAAADCPIVLDADGINAAAAHIDMAGTVSAPLILTPHPGEMARLLGTSADAVESARVGAVCRCAAETGAVSVLKGYHTLVTAPDAEVYQNETGNPGMATGGSGDLLAGMIASFVAQGMEPLDAALAGVYLHGAAGDLAASRLSQHAVLPTDMAAALGELFLQFEQ